MENFNGFGVSSYGELDELRKALSIGYTDPPDSSDTPGIGDPLRVESLEATLKVLTYQMSNLRLWQAIPKSPAFSTVEEYNQLVDYGQDTGGFVAGGVAPQTEDSTYRRQTEQVKYRGTTRIVQHPALVVRSVPGDLIAQETQNGVIWLLRKANIGLYESDADVVPESWNSVTKQIDSYAVTGAGDIATSGDFSTRVIDLRGQPLTQDAIEDAAERIMNSGFGQASMLFSNPKVFSDFSKTFHTFQRFSVPPASPGVVGTPVTGYQTMSGQISFQPDVFSRKTPTTLDAAAASGGTIAADAAATVAATNGAADSSKFTGTSEQYSYMVRGISAGGETATVADATELTGVDSGETVTVTITAGTTSPDGWLVYRSLAGGAVTDTHYLIGSIADSGAATTVFVDRNFILPNTYKALMLDMSNQSLTFRQLMPMLRMPLATIAPSIRWMQLLYGTPVVFAPGKNVVVVNIGDAV